MEIEIKRAVCIRSHKVGLSKPSIWFIHGFGDSGLAYREVFDSSLASNYNLYVVDLPGFGVSPANPSYVSLKSQADLLTSIMLKTSQDKTDVNIVAHSIGGLIGTWVCQLLGNRVNYFVNVEGNLTGADSYFSSKPAIFEDAHTFFASFEQEIFELAKKDENFRRYYSSLRFANPEVMRNWSLSGQAYFEGNKGGQEFADLDCKKMYIWGDVYTSPESRRLIEDYQIPNKLYKGIGHWPMVEIPGTFYQDLGEIISNP